MSDIFVSYARSDEARAERVAEALRADGFQVWRDDQLPAHRAYAEVIEERLGSALAVVVLWSADAAKSQWVRAEADTARNAGTLVQAALDGGIPPLPFNQIQCADLSGWRGNPDFPGWQKLLGSVRELAGDAAPAPTPAPAAKAASTSAISICVLPFQNMSGEAEQEYFSDGISEDITTDLSRVSALGVVARNTAFTFKASSVNVSEVARKLGVTHVLEGSVRKAGGRVRINAQLIDGATGEHVWAERFDRELEDIFAIQDEISKSIVRALKLKLLPQEKKAIEQRETDSVEAYNLYLLARQYWLTGNHGDMRREERVMRICGHAVGLDPNYASAWALMAMALSNLRYVFRCKVDDGYAAAHSALTIDPTIAEAHCPMIRRLEDQQRYAEADARIEEALRLDPESWEVNKEAARAYIRQGRLEDATERLEKAVEVMEGDVHSWTRLVTLFHALGDETAMRIAAESAIKQAEQALTRDPSDGSSMSLGALACAALGQGDRAREWMERAVLVDADNTSMRYNFACTHAAYLGEKDAALGLLERSFSTASAFHVAYADSDPDLDCLRGDQRFEQMLVKAKERLGIAGKADDASCRR